jgi:glycosyltransferase involved in cell wall biosynthesis
MGVAEDRPIRRYCAVSYTHYRSDPRVRREAEAMRDRGAEATVLSLREPGRPAVEDVDGVRVVSFPVPRHRGDGLGGYALSYANFFVRVGAHLARRPRHWDLVHVHSIPEALVFATIVPRLAGVPVVLDVGDLSTEVIVSRTGSSPWPVSLVERLALRFASSVVTVHEPYRDMIAARGLAPEAIGVVLNTPDDQRFPLLEPVTPGVPPRLIHHGTLVRRYGLDVVLHALVEAREEVPGVRLEIVGDGDYRSEVVRLVDELGLGDAVELSPGVIPLEQVPDRIRAADVGVVPFRDDRFTRSILPTKLLEYVRMGRPAIVSRNPVIERYFGDDEVFFVEPGDAGAVARAIVAIAADPEEAARRARRAQRFFDREGWPVARQRLYAFLEGAVST